VTKVFTGKYYSALRYLVIAMNFIDSI